MFGQDWLRNYKKKKILYDSRHSLCKWNVVLGTREKKRSVSINDSSICLNLEHNRCNGVYIGAEGLLLESGLMHPGEIILVLHARVLQGSIWMMTWQISFKKGSMAPQVLFQNSSFSKKDLPLAPSMNDLLIQLV